MNGAESIAAERARQISEEGFTPEHDDKQTVGQFVDAAIAYLTPIHGYYLDNWAHNLRKMAPTSLRKRWPSSLDKSQYKPESRRRDLVKAGALVAAEIDRLDRIRPQGDE